MDTPTPRTARVSSTPEALGVPANGRSKTTLRRVRPSSRQSPDCRRSAVTSRTRRRSDSIPTARWSKTRFVLDPIDALATRSSCPTEVVASGYGMVDRAFISVLPRRTTAAGSGSVSTFGPTRAGAVGLRGFCRSAPLDAAHLPFVLDSDKSDLWCPRGTHRYSTNAGFAPKATSALERPWVLPP